MWIFCSSKELKQLTSIINDFNNHQTLFQGINTNNSSQENLAFVEGFICRCINTWIDSDNNLYLQEEFCENGDLLDYLAKLENYDIKLLNEEFYWDLCFEILCVREAQNILKL